MCGTIDRSDTGVINVVCRFRFRFHTGSMVTIDRFVTTRSKIAPLLLTEVRVYGEHFGEWMVGSILASHGCQ